MPIVVADTGPINYLILIGHIEVLPVLFEKVILPAVVRDELTALKSPAAVQEWIAGAPSWLEVRPSPASTDTALAPLHAGERAAIALALELHAEILLIDERHGVRVARTKGLRAAGTLAVLSLAARHNLLDLSEAFDRLKRTSFHYRQELIDQFLNEKTGHD